VLVAAVLLAPLGIPALRGRWGLLRRRAGLVLAYGALAVFGAQLCYFSAVARLPVSVALLLEYTAPIAVVGWLWWRHGQRPHRLTLLGGVVCAVGLVLVLDLLSSARLDLLGVLWSLGAMVGAAVYFIVSADDDTDLPPIVLAFAGIVVAAVLLLACGLVGVVPLRVTTAAVTYRGLALPWWLAVLALGAVTAAVPYVTGIAAGRRLGSRLASFVALAEVLAALLWAWLLLAELPRAVQLFGGLLVLLGVLLVKAGEPTPSTPGELP
jgi:drug/metabolite transporter (DMT)-like permease